MDHPLLVEVNTRCWLRELSDKLGRRITLATVPEEAFLFWQKCRFTHVWLMGVWTRGTKARDLARSLPGLIAVGRDAFGADGAAELEASPYAVADYVVDPALGGADGLRQFRATLSDHGVGLVLDFVPNHLGVDHPWIVEKTELFVGSSEPRTETFVVHTAQGDRWLAHGKDPYFPSWSDTAQLDYRLATTRAAMTATLQSIASQCDGVRCDMAMLLLNDVFARTWAHLPARGHAVEGEFWAEAIGAVRKAHPRFLFMAEAYWDLEARLHGEGFDYIYDKKFFDFVTRRDWGALQAHVRAAGASFPPARFLENHDEPPIATLLDPAEQKAAAMLLLAQPGLRLLYDGQLAGRRRRAPVQFGRYWPEIPDAEIASFYERLMTSLAGSAVGAGEMKFCETGFPHCFAMQWRRDDGQIGLAAVNLASERAVFQVPQVRPSAETQCVFADPCSGWSWRSASLQIELAARGFQCLQWRANE